MDRWIVMIGALAGGAAVAMGAFATHGLAGQSAPAALDWIETGSRYGAVHAVALLAVALLAARQRSRLSLRVAAGAFTVGSILFSGTLYVMGVTGSPALATVVPVGGAAFLVGWLSLAAYALERGESESEV